MTVRGCLISLYGLLLASSLLSAQDPLEEPLEFRRLYVPQDKLKTGPLDLGVRYGPMLKADFERLVDLLRTSPPEVSRALAARIDRASYRASVTSDNCLTGQATLQIERPFVRAATAGKSGDPGALLRLSPLALAISHPHWPGDPAEDALCGLDAEGQMAVLATRAGSLVFDWTLRGTREASGAWRYNLELPSAPSASLVLDLPANLSLRSNRGVIIESMPLNDSHRRWSLELGGQNRLAIVLSPQDEARAAERLPAARQSLTYNLSPRALELTAQWTLDVPGEPLKQLELSLDAPLRLLAIRQGNTQLPFNITEDADAKIARVVVEFPEPLQGVGNIIRLGATTSITLDALWKLPGVRASGVFWQEGRATLLVPKPLVLERIALSDCRQSSIDSLPPPATGQSIGVQYFLPEAGVEVSLAHGRQQLRASSGTAIELSEDAIQGEMAVDLSVSEGQLFSLAGTVPLRWNIDTVESDPPGQIKGWSLDTPSPRKRTLDIRFAKALSADMPLRLVIRGHRVNVAVGENIAVEELRLVHFDGVGDHFMSVATPESYQLRMSGGDDLTSFDPNKLAPAIASLFTDPPQAVLFRLDPKAARLALAMQRLAPRYSAQLEVEATATAGPLWESYRIECHPQNSRVERVLVYFSHPREEAPRWRLEGEAEDLLVARRLTDEEMLAQSGRETGEMWQLTLRHPQTAPFQIRASRSSPLMPQTPLSLIWLPGAAEQDGQVQIRCAAESAVQVQTTKLKPAPLDIAAEGQIASTSSLRAKYRYSPTQDTAAAEPPPISLLRDEQTPPQAAAIVWLATLESRYERDGPAYHTASWLLENDGQSSLLLLLPTEIRVVDAWVDEKHVVARQEHGQLTIPLASDRRYSSVALHYQTNESPLGEVQRLSAPLPKSQLPVLSAEWALWLPPGYDLTMRSSSWRQLDRSPMTIMQRLLGPLARTGRPRFEPLERADWQRLADWPWDQRLAEESADAMLAQLGASLDESLDWGRLLSSIEPTLGLSQKTLLVDRYALWKAGFGPERPVDRGSGDFPASRGLARLDAARLILLVDRDLYLLTTPLAAAEWSDQWTPLTHSVLGRITHGGLRQTLTEAARQSGSNRFRMASQWSSEPLSPWHAFGRPAIETVDTPGWSVYHLSGPADAAPQVEIARQNTVDVFACGMFLLIVAACFRRIEQPAWLAAFAALAGVIALVIPEIYVPIASSAVLGFLASLTWQMIAPAPPAPLQPVSSHSFRLSDSVHTVAGVLALLALLLLSGTAWAQDAKPARTIHKVFIPVDEDDKPVGDKYWVPESLYAQMERRAARIAQEPQQWLLERADYRGTLTWDVAQQRLLVSELRVAFDLHVFESARRIKLPFAREGHVLAPADRMLVDGLETPVQWEDEGRLLCFDAAQPGQYRLELALRPTLVTSAEQTGFDLTVPPLASAHLELQLPRTSPGVEVPSALGSVSLAEEGRRLIAELGRTSRISVRWRDGLPNATVRTTLDADQLLWLKVAPGAVTVDARWKFKVVEGGVRRVQIALDPRLQLQTPLEARNPLVASSRVVAGNPQLLQIDLTRAVTDQFTLDATLRWSSASGIGNLRLPLVEPQQVRSVRRLLGVSLDPLLDHAEPKLEGSTSVTPAEFVAQWGGMDAPPRLAYRLSADAIAWSLAVRPKPLERKFDAVLAVSLSAGRSAWRYDATVDITGSCFEHRVALPPAWTIDSVEVREEGVPRLSHWSRETDGTATLFLTDPASGPQQVVLQGSAPLPRGPWRVNGLRLQDAQQRSAQLRIYRQPSVVVSIRNRNALVEQTDLQRTLESQLFETDRRYAAFGRLVSLMQADGPAHGATLVVNPNQPRFECRQVTSLKREAGVWQAEVECRINVLSGLLDALRFEIPASWRQLVITPAANQTLIETGEGARQLVVRPVTALSGQSSIRIRGNLMQPPGARLQMPAIALMDADKLERLLIVPGKIDLQPVAWETRGLSRVETPPDTTTSAGLANPETYLVVDEAFSATQQPAMRSPGQPQVSLADINISWQSDSAVQGVAAFDLEPAGNLECPLVVPAEYRLIRVLVNGLPALAASHGQTWRLPLASDELPQRVEVVFEGQLPPGSWGRQRLLAPMPGDLPVERTLWTIRGPQGSELVPSLESHAVTPLRQEIIRLRSIAGLTSLAQGVADDETVEDVAAWYQPWASRFRQSHAAAIRELLLARDVETIANLQTDLRTLEQDQARIARDLGLSANLGRTVASPLIAEQPRQFWRLAFETPQPPLRATFAQRVAELEVHRGSISSSDWPWRLLAAAVLAALGVLALVRSRWWPALHRWRYLAALSVGLAWWLWLSPSILGWVIIALTLVAAVRRRSPTRDSGSAVIRLGHSAP